MTDCQEQCTVVIPADRRMGWCERHRCEKTASWIKLCRRDQAAHFEALSRGEEPKPSLWIHWEEGHGPGQARPEPATEALRDNSCRPSGGAGMELKLLLRKFWIVAHPNCKCGQRAREMDANGIEWCEGHVEEITDWLEEEARNRPVAGLMFTRAGANVLIRRAIKNAKRKEKAK